MLFGMSLEHISRTAGGDELVLTRYIFVNSEVGRECCVVKFSWSGTIVTLFGLWFEIASTQHLAFKGKRDEKEAWGTKVQLL